MAPTFRPLVFTSMFLLVACASTRAPVETAPDMPEPEPVVIEVAAPEPEPAPSSWLQHAASVTEAAAAALELPADCSIDSAPQALTIRCGGSSVLVQLQDSSPTPDDLASVERQTIQLLAQAGAQALLMGNPYCRVGDTEAQCSFIEARSSEGIVGTGYSAVAVDGDRSFSLRCLYLADDPSALEESVPVCRQLLDFS